MNAAFLPYVADLDTKLNALLAMPPVTPGTLPKLMPKRGVYLLSDGEQHLYVGRSNNIRSRLGCHSLASSPPRSAPFAIRLAREKTGHVVASYQKGKGSVADLMLLPPFKDAFSAGKLRIRCMHVRFVEEADPIKQALLEVYVAVVLTTRYNDFDNH